MESSVKYVQILGVKFFHMERASPLGSYTFLEPATVQQNKAMDALSLEPLRAPKMRFSARIVVLATVTFVRTELNLGSSVGMMVRP